MDQGNSLIDSYEFNRSDHKICMVYSEIIKPIISTVEMQLSNVTSHFCCW